MTACALALMCQPLGATASVFGAFAVVAVATFPDNGQPTHRLDTNQVDDDVVGHRGLWDSHDDNPFGSQSQRPFPAHDGLRARAAAIDQSLKDTLERIMDQS